MAKRRRVGCEVEGCGALVTNLPRHMREVHKVCNPKERPGAKTTKRVYGGRQQCRLCGSATIRLDLHLTKVHHLEKGSQEWIRERENATLVQESSQASTDLDRCLVEFSKSLTDRAEGIARKEATAMSHVAAVRFWLAEGLSGATVRSLSRLGIPGGRIDEHLKEGGKKPQTLRVYLASLVKFMDFLAASRTWQLYLGVGNSELQTIATKLKGVGKSLQEDVLTARVAAHARGEDLLGLEPAHVARYLDSQRVARASGLLQSIGDRVALSTADRLFVRDTLCVSLMLSNAKRAGDISHLRREDVLKATPSQDGADVEIEIFEHKEAKSGKICYVRMDNSMLANLQIYATHLWNPATQTCPYLFLSKTGVPLTPSTMSKLVTTEWEKFGKEIGEDVGRMTASRNRKLTVTALRDAGGTQEECGALASHMAHSLKTAERYYDKSRKTEARHSALDRVRVYQETRRDEQAGPSGGLPDPCTRQKNLETLVVERSRVER